MQTNNSNFDRLNSTEQKFTQRAIGRKKVFLVFSFLSIIVGISLTVFYSWKAYHQPDFDVEIHFILVVMILLMGRLNLRQFKYVGILEKLIHDPQK